MNQVYITMSNFTYDVLYNDVKDITIKVKPSHVVEIIAPMNTSYKSPQKKRQLNSKSFR